MLGYSNGILSRILDSRFFCVSSAVDLICVETPDQTVPWELFRGQLVRPEHTRQVKTFHAYDLFLNETAQQLNQSTLSLKLDKEGGLVHVVRGLLAYVWEGYETQNHEICSRETTKWTLELVGAVNLTDIADENQLQSELIDLVFRAVIGLSRLPLTSVESPLPCFTLGQMGYFYSAALDSAEGDVPASLDPIALLQAETSWLAKTKLTEFLLRTVAPEQLPEVAVRFASRWQAIGLKFEELPTLLRSIINEVSLSPYTHFVDNLIQFIRQLVEIDALTIANQIDYIGYILRQLCRHLTAYDLITFHHRGANYPDALLLDAVLGEYLQLIDAHLELFADDSLDSAGQSKQKRMRRRALRQGWLMRRYYEGLPVPDAPTSPGENARVLPSPHVRVPEEQILQTIKRAKKLFENGPQETPLTDHSKSVLVKSIADLDDAAELQELGTAIFIDRPLGYAKELGEPDRTLLFSHIAFSRSIAKRRLEFLAAAVPSASDHDWEQLKNRFETDVNTDGIAASRYAQEPSRVVSLADAARASHDFLLVRTTNVTVKEFLRQYAAEYTVPNESCQPSDIDFEFLKNANRVLIAPEPATHDSTTRLLVVYDQQMQKRIELVIDASEGYETVDGAERPLPGIRLARK